ncbi:hypothetical protein EGR_08252 [Echinococcus granulosus]|uniref:Uncharacterized protein n=1 Tax=Echinococcus granulosus TaxID=6210 RepID=W6U6R4_ECHGR|nr:hypothetical protein EGR_08252 [Echinococcus granulosus]EUB56900.1 hypothetical protein EGR_08252 [Echinococcus granulosus]
MYDLSLVDETCKQLCFCSFDDISHCSMEIVVESLHCGTEGHTKRLPWTKNQSTKETIGGSDHYALAELVITVKETVRCGLYEKLQHQAFTVHYSDGFTHSNANLLQPDSAAVHLMPYF